MADMLLPESETRAQSQRIQVEIEPTQADGRPFGKRVKIRVENYHEFLARRASDRHRRAMETTEYTEYTEKGQARLGVVR
jgi:hypothetical protein